MNVSELIDRAVIRSNRIIRRKDPNLTWASVVLSRYVVMTNAHLTLLARTRLCTGDARVGILINGSLMDLCRSDYTDGLRALYEECQKRGAVSLLPTNNILWDIQSVLTDWTWAPIQGAILWAFIMGIQEGLSQNLLRYAELVFSSAYEPHRNSLTCSSRFDAQRYPGAPSPHQELYKELRGAVDSWARSAYIHEVCEAKTTAVLEKGVKLVGSLYARE